jgi:hypothetical protein
MFMTWRIIRITMQPTRILMWLLSDRNLLSNNNSANNKDSTTAEIDQGDRAPTEATATTNWHRIKAPMLPEMVNSASTARF